MSDPTVFNPVQNQPLMADKDLPKLTAPMKPVKAKEVKYYFCSALHHSMIRTDGKKLTFIWGVYRTDDKNDQKYLDEEIDGGNFYVRYATEQEIETYNMRTDPRGTLTKTLKPQIEQQVRQETLAHLRQQLVHAREKGLNQLTDEQIDQLLHLDDGSGDSVRLATDTGGKDSGGVNVGEGGKIASGTGTLSGLHKLSELAAQQSGSTGSGTGAFQSSITGSDKVENAAESNSK